MARRVSKRTGRKMARKGRARRARVSRLANSEFASAKQTIRLDDDAMNQILILDDVNLSQFDRLVNIAANYQFYRLQKITFKWLPYSDTFFTSGAQGEAVPYLHYLIQKTEVLNPVAGSAGFNQIRDSGAKPIRFDDKTITVSWKPRVPTAVANDSTAAPALSFASASKVSPWLPTNNASNLDPFGWVASTVPHKGMVYGVEQAYTTFEGTRLYGVEITVHAQFKKPLMVAPNTVEGQAPELAKKKTVVAK